MQENTTLLRQSLEKTSFLVSDIEKTSEVINVVAINASIEAAHVGKTGAAFSVIAGEVKKLSDLTRKNSNQIAEFLKEVNSRIEYILKSTSVLSETFSELTRMINATVSTLAEITSRMEGINAASKDVLQVMEVELSQS